MVRTGIGVERANHAQVAALATDAPISKIRRAVRRSGKRQKIVNVQDLSEDQRLAFYVGRAVLGAIGQAVRDSFKNKVAKATNVDDPPLSVKDTLALFAKVRPAKSTNAH